MKYSIRIRFTLIFIGIMAFLIGVMFMVNNIFLSRYYFNEKVSSLKLSYETVDEVVRMADASDRTIVELVGDEFGQNTTDTPVSAMFRSLNDQSNINIVMIDKYDRAFIAASREGNWMESKLRFFMRYQEEIRNGTFPSDMVPEANANEEYPEGVRKLVEAFLKSIGYNVSITFDADDLGRRPRVITIERYPNYVVQQNYDSRSGSSYLECWGSFSDGETMFLMSMPIAHIEDSVKIMNRFLLIVGMLVLALGSIVIFFTTGAITKPINDLAAISKRMAKLDFGVRYDGKRQDELGVLGASMNDMSEQLEKTIAELKTANLQLQKDIEEKTRIDDMRKDFISNISHELKTPIALIEGYAEGLTEGMAEDPESRDYYCNVIMDEAVKMNKMVRQLTSLTNLEFGNDAIEIQCFDLKELVQSILEAQRISSEEKGAIVTNGITKELYVWGDEFKIEEVLTNYYTNALNHLGGDRHIDISFSLLENPKAASLSKGAGADAERCSSSLVRVSVYNDGEQIPKEDIDRIWEKFYKVDKARTRAYGGSGIGLSIVKAIMEAHGQRYGVINREHGVEFWFELELSSNEKRTV